MSRRRPARWGKRLNKNILKKGGRRRRKKRRGWNSGMEEKIWLY